MVDAVIVLANRMEADGSLNPESTLRAAKAAEVFYDRQAAAVVTCGWAYRNDCALSIAEAYQQHLITHHRVAKDSIFTERRSKDTVGEALFTKMDIVVPQHWKTLAVVTSEYHVARTTEIFEFIYGNDFDLSIVGVPITPTAEMLEKEKHSLEAFYHTFTGVSKGDTAAILKTLQTRHPFYSAI